MARKRSKRGGGGKRRGKVHHPARWREHGQTECSPWIKYKVNDTQVEVVGVKIFVQVLAWLREKHTWARASFEPRAFLAEVKYYLPRKSYKVLEEGTTVGNRLTDQLPSQEAMMFV